MPDLHVFRAVEVTSNIHAHADGSIAMGTPMGCLTCLTNDELWAHCVRCKGEWLKGSPVLCQTHSLCAMCHLADGVTPRT